MRLCGEAVVEVGFLLAEGFEALSVRPEAFVAERGGELALLEGFEVALQLAFQAGDFGDELVLRFEERDGIAKTARLTANGLDVELFHILTFT